MRAWSAGQPGALDHLIEAVYPELHAIAQRYFKREKPGHTLQCTALINEAYLRLAKTAGKEWSDRAHFFGFAAHLMHGILVDHARAHQAAKRGAGAITITLSDSSAGYTIPEVDLVDLHTALEELQQLDPSQSQIVELRFFGGLSIEEAAQVLGSSRSSVKRDWVLAKTWIHRRLTDGKVSQ